MRSGKGDDEWEGRVREGNGREYFILPLNCYPYFGLGLGNFRMKYQLVLKSCEGALDV